MYSEFASPESRARGNIVDKSGDFSTPGESDEAIDLLRRGRSNIMPKQRGTGFSTIKYGLLCAVSDSFYLNSNRLIPPEQKANHCI